MRIAGTPWEAGALSPLTRSSALGWLPWGPAAGRAASGLMVGTKTGNTLSWLASSPNANLRSLANVSDNLLSAEASLLLTRAGKTTLFTGGYNSTSPPNEPISDPWQVSWFPDRLPSADTPAELFTLVQYATGHKDHADWVPPKSATGANLLVPELFSDGSPFGGGSSEYATLAMQAQQAEPAPAVAITQNVTKDDFKVLGGLLGAGFLGGTVGVGASLLGAPAPLAVALGGAAGSAALWYIADRFSDAPLNAVWDLIASTIGKVVDKALDWLMPGEALSSKPDTAAAKNVGDLITTSNVPVVGELVDATWDSL